jgi:hypothetical protein
MEKESDREREVLEKEENKKIDFFILFDVICSVFHSRTFLFSL